MSLFTVSGDGVLAGRQLSAENRTEGSGVAHTGCESVSCAPEQVLNSGLELCFLHN